ncbi:hypothetical protein PTRA_a0021 [Pseudoalteromonas translucida KMM 520]|uniref:Uncharacterized protein n=1 Tax=Pseudoalteromonas translucida KMM 520 TaxID=1315283 RepID=A0A0U2V9M5_9GAMM|nr:hypothetical protein PTRA_a0021 [Pseudoalteromonas translucida KMM 520]
MIFDMKITNSFNSSKQLFYIGYFIFINTDMRYLKLNLINRYFVAK